MESRDQLERPVRGLNLLPFGGTSPRRLLVKIETELGGVLLDYRLLGDRDALADVLVPGGGPHPEGTFREGLWTSTCFEAFLMEEDGPAYMEYNFSLCGDWTCYRFTSCRTGRQPVASSASPVLAAGSTPESFFLRARLDVPNLGTRQFRAGLTAVLELRGGEREFWASVHPGDRPDFHDPRGFSLTLPG